MQKRIDAFYKILFLAFIAVLGFAIVNLAGYLYYTRPQIEEDSLQGYIDWADRLADYGDFDTAIEAVQAAIDQEPLNAESYVFLANVYLQNRDIEKAKAVYETAVARAGENELFTDGIDAIANIDLVTDPEKSKAATKYEEDSQKYALTYKYNSNGDMVYAYSRSHDWERPDLESFYEYNADNQLVRVIEINSFALPNYITYDYHSNGQTKNETRCDYNGFVLNRSVYDEKGVKTGNEVYSEDRSYYVETLDAEGYVHKKEFYDADDQLLYYAEYQVTDAENYEETTVYYNADNTVKYTILHKYGSSVKNVERETYLNGDGSLKFIVDHGDDKYYHLYTDADSRYDDGGEYVTHKFYADMEEYVFEQLGVLK